MKLGTKFINTYEFVCRDKEGNIVWSETVKNLVTTEGLNDLLTQYFKGSSYNAAWYAGLIDNAGFGAIQAGDTAAKITNTTPNAPTTNNWAESEAYDESVRQTVTLGSAAAGSISNTASKAVFTMNSSKTINGAFIVSVSGKHATTGKLYGAASFGTAQPVISGNTITLTVTLSVAST